MFGPWHGAGAITSLTCMLKTNTELGCDDFYAIVFLCKEKNAEWILM